MTRFSSFKIHWNFSNYETYKCHIKSISNLSWTSFLPSYCFKSFLFCIRIIHNFISMSLSIPLVQVKWLLHAFNGADHIFIISFYDTIISNVSIFFIIDKIFLLSYKCYLHITGLKITRVAFLHCSH
jgi:hypothetical protein